ncbi:hypothetical protein GCM10010136_10720 [Limoniibacter endophyticus]|uniref:Uncharacterized protein n=1 Tax=Limoniibacter endophyticus TaxID=1565040 RepID=A0A8J3DNR2_9HYPH|nr:hypothetical protein GCM10010136_10720 [Limoniibacter endophyticus]
MLAVLGVIFKTHRIGLDRDTALALDIHRVKYLIFHLALFNRTGHLDQTIGKGGLAVVDVGNDGEIANIGQLCAHGPHLAVAEAKEKQETFDILP